MISAKALSGMVQISFAGYSQFKHPALYVMLVVMVATAVIQVKYLNQAMKNFDSTVVVPTNFVFFTMSAIVAGELSWLRAIVAHQLSWHSAIVAGELSWLRVIVAGQLWLSAIVAGELSWLRAVVAGELSWLRAIVAGELS